MRNYAKETPQNTETPRSDAALDIAANRNSRKWSNRELFGRILWDVVHPLFALSPRPCWLWRRVLLRIFGAKVGEGVHIYPTVRITIPWNLRIGDQSAIGDRVIVYALGPITIGKRVTVSQGAHLCGGTHDYHNPTMPLVKAPIAIDDDAWVCADAFVGPHVTIGRRAIVAARAVAVSDVAAGVVVGGNPCRMLKVRDLVPSTGKCNPTR